MSSSKPTTPVTSRHQFSYEPTRIPQPSPQPLRRSLSLRLRSESNNSKYVSYGGGGGGDIIDHTSPTKPSLNTSTSPGNKYFRKGKLPNSKSLSFIGESSRSSGMAHLNGSSSKETSPISNGSGPSNHYNNKYSPNSTVVPSNCKQNHDHHHGMVRLFIFFCVLFL